MNYNTYEEAIRHDVADEIANIITYDENIAEMVQRENPQNNQLLIDTLYDILESGDLITGNITGSYFCNQAMARDFVLSASDTHDILEYGLNNGIITAANVGRLFIQEQWEELDVLIREIKFSSNYENYICEYFKTL